MNHARNLVIVAALCALLGLGCETRCEPSAGTICTIAGSELAGFLGDGADAQEAQLYLPMDATLGPDGSLYLADWNNHRIRAVDPDGVIDTIAGTGLLGDGPVGPALSADFNHPTSVSFGPDGDLYIAAWHNSRIRMIDMDTGIMSDVCGTGGRSYAGDDGPALMAVLDLPAGVQLDDEGNLFVVDQANQVIRRITPDGTITRIAGQCIVDECAEGQVPTACPGGSGKFSCTMAENPMACMSPCLPSFSGDGGPALEARFALPFGQAADPAGRLALTPDGGMYLADSRNHRIRYIDADGMVSTYAGTGEAGFAGDGGPATEAQLDNPVDLALAEDGTLYVADTFNSCVRAISPEGVISTIAGVCGERGFEGDGGPPAEALLDRPYGIDLAGDRLYITDTHNHRVRVIVL